MNFTATKVSRRLTGTLVFVWQRLRVRVRVQIAAHRHRRWHAQHRHAGNQQQAISGATWRE